MAVPFLDQYEPLDIIGNGSFGIIRKVRRKQDGLIFARKELNFERMSERDRKQIVSEVNILKELHHDHIVRYHDRYVDRDAGILYILMEYCGGGDLSTIIKLAAKQNRPIPEDTIWNYFMQILLALYHCHHPNNGHTRSSSGSGGPSFDSDGKERRAQILHRDLKPDNVFLDENNCVKLGDFGLSKALAQSSFANTYVGTPYYMSPELMQEKAYDSKSDIWSLGCLIYELCALKPPFHEAKTHSELSIFIRNGRIPPLPKGYSQVLSGVIKAMLNLNPAMRPSAAQLLQHERLELAFKVTEAEKMLSTVKSHKATVIAREQAVAEREQHISALLSQKDQENANLQQMVSQLQALKAFSQHDVEVAIKEAIARREVELRILVTKREEEVAAAISKREEELMGALRAREAELCQAWVVREEELRKDVGESIRAVEERVRWIEEREKALEADEERLEIARRDVTAKLRKWEELGKSKKEKAPLDEVKNLLEPLARALPHTTEVSALTPKPMLRHRPFPPLNTPITRPDYQDFIPSAMKGVVLTSTGETLATPSPAELDNVFDKSPKVGLNFTKIFDFNDSEAHDKQEEEHSPPPSPSARKERERRGKETVNTPDAEVPSPQLSTSSLTSHPPTRIRKPSIRSGARPPGMRSTTAPEASGSGASTSSSTSGPASSYPKPLPHPHLRSNSVDASHTTVTSQQPSCPQYDLADEENLPSPFLKRAGGINPGLQPKASTTMPKAKKRVSVGNALRTVAALNNAGRRGVSPSEGLEDTRPVLASARKASEEARKALLRQ